MRRIFRVKGKAMEDVIFIYLDEEENVAYVAGAYGVFEEGRFKEWTIEEYIGSLKKHGYKVTELKLYDLLKGRDEL